MSRDYLCYFLVIETIIYVHLETQPINIFGDCILQVVAYCLSLNNVIFRMGNQTLIY